MQTVESICLPNINFIEPIDFEYRRKVIRKTSWTGESYDDDDKHRRNKIITRRRSKSASFLMVDVIDVIDFQGSLS